MTTFKALLAAARNRDRYGAERILLGAIFTALGAGVRDNDWTGVSS